MPQPGGCYAASVPEVGFLADCYYLVPSGGYLMGAIHHDKSEYHI